MNNPGNNNNGVGGPRVRNNNNGARENNPFFHFQNRLFHALFYRITLTYARAFPRPIRRILEFALLLKVCSQGISLVWKSFMHENENTRLLYMNTWIVDDEWSFMIFPLHFSTWSHLVRVRSFIKIWAFANLLHHTDRHDCPTKVKDQIFIGAF